MTKEYLKMADAFVDPSNTEVMSIGSAQIKPEFDDGVTAFDYAAHAINSHDELVAEIERLREFERDAMRYRFLRDNCTTQQADSCGPIFVMTIRQKNNPFNVGLSIDEAMNGSRTDE